MKYIVCRHDNDIKTNQQEKIQMCITPLSDEIEKENIFIDNEMQDGLTNVTLISRLLKAGINKRSGESIQNIVYCLLIWPLLKKASLHAFCGKFIESYTDGKLGVLYDFLKRSDINWRKHSRNMSVEIIQRHDLLRDPDACFAVDDTIKVRRGKGVEGASSHYCHTTKKHVMGHQVVQLILSADKGALPVDQRIYVSNKKVQEREEGFDDNRSAVAKDYKSAIEDDKNSMFREMLKNTVRLGINPQNVLGDTWYGNKGNIDEIIKLGMTAIFAMKRSKMYYRFQGKMYTATQLFKMQRRRMTKNSTHRFVTGSLIVELNLEADSKKEPRWIKVKLLFSKEKKCNADNWIVILCTDIGYSDEKVIRLYSRRWAVEVYFKEVKQNLGFLANQSGDYCTHYSTLHLTTLRYLVLFNLMLDNGGLNFAQYRKKSADALESVSFAAVLWDLFKYAINSVLDTFISAVGSNMVNEMKNTIATQIEAMLLKALRIDSVSIEEDLAAEPFICS